MASKGTDDLTLIPNYSYHNLMRLWHDWQILTIYAWESLPKRERSWAYDIIDPSCLLGIASSHQICRSADHTWSRCCSDMQRMQDYTRITRGWHGWLNHLNLIAMSRSSISSTSGFCSSHKNFKPPANRQAAAQGLPVANNICLVNNPATTLVYSKFEEDKRKIFKIRYPAAGVEYFLEHFVHFVEIRWDPLRSVEHFVWARWARCLHVVCPLGSSGMQPEAGVHLSI